MRLLAAAALACACSTPAPATRLPAGAQAPGGARDSAGDAAEFVASLRAEYGAIGRSQRLLGWYELTRGDKPLAEVSYLGHGLGFERAALDAVGAAQKRPGLSANDALALRFFRRALTTELLTLATAKLDDALAGAEANATVTVPWLAAPLAFRDVGNALALEPDAARRSLLFAAQGRVVLDQLNPLLEAREAAAQKAARESGFPDYVALSENLREVRLPALLEEGVRYVEATDALYPRLLERVAREELGLSRAQLRVSDLSRLSKAPTLARHFDKALELPALRHFLGGIGLDLRTAANTEVLVDDSLVAKKAPRAFVEAVDAPGDVRLSVKPVGGLDDYWTLFHEAGHAVHFANATVEPRELVDLGHGAPTEAFGELFRGAFSDGHWLFRYRAFLVAQGRPAPTDAELAAVLRRTALVEMTYLRHYAFARIAYELRLHGRPESEIAPALALLGARPKTLRDLYRALFSRACGVELDDADAGRYRLDVDGTFYSADYARSFALAGMMQEALRRKFGDDWYGDERVGRFLKRELFAPGTSLSAEDVAQKLGFARAVDFGLAARRASRLVAEADALEKSR